VSQEKTPAMATSTSTSSPAARPGSKATVSCQVASLYVAVAVRTGAPPSLSAPLPPGAGGAFTVTDSSSIGAT